MSKSKLEGKKDKAVGKVKEVTGKAVDNEELERKGKNQQTKGEIEEELAKNNDDNDNLETTDDIKDFVEDRVEKE